MFGIENYNPHFNSSTKEIVTKVGEELKKLIGKKITETWVVWETKNNKWFKDCPVVINIEGIQVEICTSKVEELSITFNTIDMSNELNWYDIDDFKLEWREGAFSELLLGKDKKINSVEIIEYKFQSEVVFSKDKPKSQGDKNSAWVLNGIGFELDNGYFSVYNGLDENEISIEPDLSDHIRTFKILK